MYGVWRQPSWLLTRPDTQDIRQLRVTPDLMGRPDKIADIAYGTIRLEWVIIAFNNALGALNWPPVGAVVEYPADYVVYPELS